MSVTDKKTYTPNLNLAKPDYEHFADIGDLNDNFDKIDEAYGNIGDTESLINELRTYDITYYKKTSSSSTAVEYDLGTGLTHKNLSVDVNFMLTGEFYSHIDITFNLKNTSTGSGQKPIMHVHGLDGSVDVYVDNTHVKALTDDRIQSVDFSNYISAGQTKKIRLMFTRGNGITTLPSTTAHFGGLQNCEVVPL